MRTETKAAVKWDTATFIQNLSKPVAWVKSKERHSTAILYTNFKQGKLA
jgi:hypothetical protein